MYSVPYLAFMIPLYAALLLLLLAWTYFSRKLTLAGTITAGVVAVAIFAGTGFIGIILLGAFFFLGTAATYWQKDKKVKAALAEPGSTRRTAGQVLANGGVAALLAIISWQMPEQVELLTVMLAGAFSAATADTLSSELGVLYGKRCFNIRTFKPDQKGLDGVVSAEGTMAGVVGSLLIGLLLARTPFFSPTILIVIVVAGTVGNFTDSWLGATLERKQKLGNNAVNLINTATGAICAGLLWVWL